MLSVDEALDRVLADIEPQPPVQVDLIRAVGRALAEPIVARRALPPWDNSAMDGYAVRAAEATTGATLPVSQHIPAGAAPSPLVPGTAARIFTGAPLPAGADAIVMQESTTAYADPEQVHFTEGATLGRHVRRQGEDVQAGAEVLSPGRVITPGDVALMASLGRSRVYVVGAPRVAIVSSGDELVEVDAGPPGPGQIVNSNVLALAAAVESMGVIAEILPIIPDDRAATFEHLRRAAQADALITSGGVSVGDHDHVGHVLRALAGPSFSFWKVAIKPGKPLAFGHIGRCAAFGLPGNPVSALVTFELFVRPALRKMLGHHEVRPRFVPATLESPLPAAGRRTEFVRVQARYGADGALYVSPRATQSSGALSSIGGADALVRVPIGVPAYGAGSEVRALLL